MTIYNPFHSIGFFSVFETETLRNVDVLTGGFAAEHGGRISAVVDITTRDGSPTRYGGLASVNPFQSKLLFEGPLSRLEEDKNWSSSFLVTGKTSYLDRTSKTLYNYIDTLGLPYSYTDLYGKVSFSSALGTKFNIFGFNYNDNVNYEGLADLGWNSYGLGTNFKVVPQNTKLIIDGRIAYSDYQAELQENDEAPRKSGIAGFNAGLDFSFYNTNSEFKYGIELLGFRTDFEFRNFLGVDFNQIENTTEIATFFKYKQNIKDKFLFEPSVRLHYYASLNDLSLEPRLGMKYNATSNLRFKFAGGLYSQNLISTVNERDVVNLFVGFLSGPDQSIFKPGTTEKTNTRLQTSFHGVAGVEYDFSRDLSLNVEPYYKGFTQLINLNREKIEPNDPDYVTETGEAYGIDFLLKYDTKRYFFWAAYSYGFVNRDDGEQVYPTLFDRRHNLNLLGTYKFGSDLDFELSVRWNYGSGFPFTLTQGFYQDYQFDDGIDTDITSNNGNIGVIYDEKRNAGRLSDYHRMDISLKKEFEFSKYRKLEAVASITNVYSRKNIFYFDRIEYDRVYQLPILPSIGLTFTF